MPRRYFDIGSMDPTMNSDTPPQKTQRSHEENQERAYIAASRRGDRSIEARVQSARMASDIHKERTRKALYVSEAIVLKEETYEEVEEGFPQSYQLLGPHLQSSFVEMNSRVDAYLKSRVAKSELVSARDQDWRENEVNREFAQHFPQVDQSLRSRRWSTPSFLIAPPAQCDGLQNHPGESFESTTQHINYTQGPVPDAQSRSLPGSSPSELGADIDTLTPPALTPESASHLETPWSQAESVFGNAMHTNSFQDCNSDESALTADPLLKAKMLLAESGQSDAIDPVLFDQQWVYADAPLNNAYEVSKRIKMEDEKDSQCELYIDSLDSMNWGAFSRPNISINEVSRNTFINDIAWENDQQ